MITIHHLPLLRPSESSSADHELRLFPPRDSSRRPPPRHRPDHLNPPRHVGRVFGTHLHHGRPAGLAKAPPSALLGSGGQRGLTLLERPHAAVSARHLVTVVSKPPSDWMRPFLFSAKPVRYLSVRLFGAGLRCHWCSLFKSDQYVGGSRNMKALDHGG